MATTKKRSGGSRAASGGSRAASGSRSSGGKRTSSGKRASGGGSRASSSRSGSAKRQTAPAPKPFRREVGALVCLLLAIFAAFGYFHMKALFIDLFCALLKGLLGYGFWLMPPALVLCAYILAFHRGRPVALRLCCALALPLALSVMLHGLLSQVLPWDAALIKTLWATGEELKSGGALGGLLAWTTPDDHPHATTAHRQFSYVEPTQGGILLEHGDTPRKYTVYAIGTDGRMIVGDVTV